MKRLIAFFLLSGILMQVFSKQLIVAEYSLNKKFISSVLCINKANPLSHCQGKCHLRQELAKDDENQPVRDSKSKAGVETVWITGSVLNVSFLQLQEVLVPSTFIPERCINVLDDIFHPPGC